MIKPEIKIIKNDKGTFYSVSYLDLKAGAGYDQNGIMFVKKGKNMEEVGIQFTRIYCRMFDEFKQSGLSYSTSTTDVKKHCKQMQFIAKLGYYCGKMVGEKISTNLKTGLSTDLR